MYSSVTTKQLSWSFYSIELAASVWWFGNFIINSFRRIFSLNVRQYLFFLKQLDEAARFHSTLLLPSPFLLIFYLSISLVFTLGNFFLSKLCTSFSHCLVYWFFTSPKILMILCSFLEIIYSLLTHAWNGTASIIFLSHITHFYFLEHFQCSSFILCIKSFLMCSHKSQSAALCMLAHAPGSTPSCVTQSCMNSQTPAIQVPWGRSHTGEPPQGSEHLFLGVQSKMLWI